MLKYIKVLGLTKQNIRGYYNPKTNTIFVDFSEGILRAVLTSYHEITHKIITKTGVEDWLDILTNVHVWKHPKIIFMKAEIIPEREHAIISEKEFPDYVLRGWDFVSVLPNGKILIEK